MNARTAKLIRRYTTAAGQNYRAGKRTWNRLPKSKRAAMRVALKESFQKP